MTDVVADHVRSLMADHLMDVPTSDQHTVKPWLSARLDLSPVVKDFAAEGYPLVGGRLDYVDGHRAAAIVYHRDKHVINLFAFVSGDRANSPPRQEKRDGFNIVEWRMGGAFLRRRFGRRSIAVTGVRSVGAGRRLGRLRGVTR